MSKRATDGALDEVLVLASQNGSSEAFVTLFDRWQPRLLAHAVHMLGGRRYVDIAEDVCQETWLAIGRGLPRLEQASAFPAWAYAIVGRRAADRLRRADRHDRAATNAAALSVNRVAASDDSPLAEVEVLRAALDTLPPADRALLRLFYLEQFTIAEVAEALSIPGGTVKSRLFLARQRLRQEMQRRHR